MLWDRLSELLLISGEYIPKVCDIILYHLAVIIITLLGKRIKLEFWNVSYFIISLLIIFSQIIRLYEWPSMEKDVSLSHMLTKAAVINNTNNSNTVYIFLLLSMLKTVMPNVFLEAVILFWII